MCMCVPNIYFMSMIYSSTVDQDFDIVACLPSSQSTRSPIKKHSGIVQFHVRQSSHHNKSYMSENVPLGVTLKTLCQRKSSV